MSIDRWKRIINELSDEQVEIHTVPSNRKTPLWFVAKCNDNIIIIDKANINKPSCKLSGRRKISFKDFEIVNSYYDRWKSGETGIRHEVSRKSRNTAYIFALINKYCKE